MGWLAIREILNCCNSVDWVSQVWNIPFDVVTSFTAWSASKFPNSLSNISLRIDPIITWYDPSLMIFLFSFRVDPYWSHCGCVGRNHPCLHSHRPGEHQPGYQALCGTPTVRGMWRTFFHVIQIYDILLSCLQTLLLLLSSTRETAEIGVGSVLSTLSSQTDSEKKKKEKKFL